MIVVEVFGAGGRRKQVCKRDWWGDGRVRLLSASASKLPSLASSGAAHGGKAVPPADGWVGTVLHGLSLTSLQRARIFWGSEGVWKTLWGCSEEQR